MDTEELVVGSEGGEIIDVTSVEPLENYKLKVSLSDGRRGIFDVSPYLDQGVFRELKDIQYFNRVYVAYNTVVWPHEQDIDPELIELELQPEPANTSSIFVAENQSNFDTGSLKE
jgi:hypothetical protein